MSIVSQRIISLLGGTLFLGALFLVALPADAEEEEATETEEASEAAEAEKPRGRRPVLAPGQESPAAPPSASGLRPVRQQQEEEDAPDIPPPPLEFADEVHVPAVEVEKEEEEVAADEEIADPGEVRYLTRKGNLHVEMRVRPGIPRPGEPVEVTWLLQEQLLIPDPYLGDRKPVSDVALVATVGGPEARRLFELHPGSRPGAFGFTFTPHATGNYQIQIARRDGRSGLDAEMHLPVGQPPLPSSRTLEVRRYPRPTQDPQDFEATMRSLGQRWIRLERAAGTADAAEAHAELLSFAEAIRDGAPAKHKAAFTGMAQAIGGIPNTGSREAILTKMDEVNLQACMRCHSVGRFEFAVENANWPAYTPNTELRPPAATSVGGRRGRGPVRPVQP